MKRNKKIKNKKSKPVSMKKLFNVFILVFLFSIMTATASYFMINKNEEKNVKKTVQIKKEEKQNNFEIFEKTNLHILTKEDIDKIFEEKQEKINQKQIEEKQKTQKNTVKVVEKKDYVYNKKTKAKLAIIIDDVASNRQKQNILKISKKITMSFLPPISTHKNSAKIAQNLPFYMIHFPMQASAKFKSIEKNTLTIYDSYESIEKRVRDLRKWYPEAKYTNNHTGSVFTKNDKAMTKLFKALDKYNFIFVDSKTTGKSLGKKYAKKYNMPYIARDIFLDNVQEFQAIQIQLKKAIKIAKKKGYAIAIGHPYKITLKVLRNSKHLFKDIELILVKDLPYLK